MGQLVTVVQDLDLVAFCVLGVATGATWLRRREAGIGFLALAIVLLSTVFLLAQLPVLFHAAAVPLITQVELVLFMASGYALLRYRASVIPLSPRRHGLVVAAAAISTAGYLVAQAVIGGTAVLTVGALAVIAVWSAMVGEPIVRFWLLSRDLPAVQAWRLRSLGFGFGGLILVLLVAFAIDALSAQPVAQAVTGLAVLLIVPLLYLSFSPPAWLRREWRAAEEEGLRAFMQELLVEPDSEALGGRALEWAMRLVGGQSAVLFDGQGKVVTDHDVDSGWLSEIVDVLPRLPEGAGRTRLGGSERGVLVLRIAGLSESSTLVIVAGPFTPALGVDEVRRAQQFTSAYVNALDRKRILSELELTNARLKEASHHKSLFLANMSHELRTPLNAIIGFSELLTDAQPDQFDAATRKRFLNQIVTSGKHLLSLINDILDLSKVEAGQMELRLDLISVADVVDQVCRTVEPLVAKKGIKLETDAGEAGELRADPAKVKQMLLNLVSNAIKFTPEGGRVTISAHRGAGFVDIAVADTGIGISAADQGQIFKEFHQVDSGAGRRHEGTGLGLALTKRFALLHGGDVRLNSVVDHGSVFTLTLPLNLPTPPPAPQPQVASMNGNGSGSLILVVEDDSGAAELLTRQLTSAGYRTQVARTGNEALAKARELKPAAITLDIILPGLDGWEVMTRLKKDPATSAIPILVVSVVDNPELGMALGAMDYLVKPVDGEQLVERLSRFASTLVDGGPQLRVLVVDDEAANRDLLRQTLEPAGFKVIAASGGTQAIRMARVHKPDVVLLDLMMPEVTGFDVVEALRSDSETSATPIMILTAATLSEAEKARLNGRVSQILSRGSVAAADVIGLLRQAVAQRSVA